MMKHDGLDRYAAPQIPETDITDDSNIDELTTSPPTGDRQVDPWPAIRQAVHVYARDPTEKNALAVEVSLRFLRRQRDLAQSSFRS